MPYRNLATLESWLTEFRDLGYEVAGSLKVIVQDGDAGADTGLVGVHLAYASTAVYVQPVPGGIGRWEATMEPRDDAVVLDAAGLLRLSGELAMLSTLCTFLQTKSQVCIDTDAV
ncbi:hypothetical protein QL996_05260 [Planococcus sp. APC 4015]|nr:hypothetical protein [Planococcus sp. APC 4015]